MTQYTRRFIHLKCQVSDIQEAMVIESVASSLKTGPARRQIRAEEPQTLELLLKILEAQARGEEDELKESKTRGKPMQTEHFSRPKEKPAGGTSGWIWSAA